MKGASPRPIAIINSGAYVVPELVAEFGELPPAFLPVGLGRLYEHQARLLEPLHGDLFLTLPQSFELPVWDAERLDALDITVIRTPDALELGGALLHALGRIGFCDRALRILHGDTLVEGLDPELDDAIAVADGGDGYRWAHVRGNAAATVEAVIRPSQWGTEASGKRLCGYFAFRSAARLAECLARSNNDFFEGLNLYVAERGLQMVEPRQWLDFGHVQTFFHSRRIVTTERAFNTLEIGRMHVRKRSASATAKLEAEARWLREVPSTVAPFCARLIGEGRDASGYYYDSEYEFMPTLAELYVFGRVTPARWRRILNSCADFIDAGVAAGGTAPVAGEFAKLVLDKTRERLSSVAEVLDLELDSPNMLNGHVAPSLRACMNDIEAVLRDCVDKPSVMHGDFCFSNILYNFRTDRVRLIDPRALTEQGEFSVHGDRRYDLAKLMHSVCGRYDLIMAGHYAGERMGQQAFRLSFFAEPWRLEIEAMAKGLSMGGVGLGSKVVWAAMTSLFLSMPPLHADRPDRQIAFIANALRLHAELEHAT